MDDQVRRAHKAAVDSQQPTYTDPHTGYQVFTESALKARGSCCASGCRHCPFGHESVPLQKRAEKIKQPAWLSAPAHNATTVLFWSGGKNSFLALRALRREKPDEQIALLTSFDSGSRVIEHQGIAIHENIEQAKSVSLPLIGVPESPLFEYMTQIVAALELLPALETVAFGDHHLEPIRTWREDAFHELCRRRSVRLAFPLWRASYDVLLDDLEASGVRLEVSAVTHADLAGAVGQTFDRDFVARLPGHIDSFGENGEFHTKLLVS